MKFFFSIVALLTVAPLMQGQLPPTSGAPSAPQVWISVCALGQTIPVTYDANMRKEVVDPKFRPPQQVFFKTGKQIKKNNSSRQEDSSLPPALRNQLEGESEEEYGMLTLRLNLPTEWEKFPKVGEPSFVSLLLENRTVTQTGVTTAYEQYLRAQLPPKSQGALMFLFQKYPNPEWPVPPGTIMVPLESFMTEMGQLEKNRVLLVNSFPFDLLYKVGDRTGQLKASSFIVLEGMKPASDISYKFQAYAGGKWIDFDNSDGTFQIPSNYARCFSFHLNYQIKNKRHPLQFSIWDIEFPNLQIPQPNLPPAR